MITRHHLAGFPPSTSPFAAAMPPPYQPTLAAKAALRVAPCQATVPPQQ